MSLVGHQFGGAASGGAVRKKFRDELKDCSVIRARAEPECIVVRFAELSKVRAAYPSGQNFRVVATWEGGTAQVIQSIDEIERAEDHEVTLKVGANTMVSIRASLRTSGRRDIHGAVWEIPDISTYFSSPALSSSIEHTQSVFERLRAIVAARHERLDRLVSSALDALLEAVRTSGLFNAAQRQSCITGHRALRSIRHVERITHARECIGDVQEYADLVRAMEELGSSLDVVSRMQELLIESMPPPPPPETPVVTFTAPRLWTVTWGVGDALTRSTTYVECLVDDSWVRLEECSGESYTLNLARHPELGDKTTRVRVVLLNDAGQVSTSEPSEEFTLHEPPEAFSDHLTLLSCSSDDQEAVVKASSAPRAPDILFGVIAPVHATVVGRVAEDVVMKHFHGVREMPPRVAIADAAGRMVFEGLPSDVREWNVWVFHGTRWGASPPVENPMSILMVPGSMARHMTLCAAWDAIGVSAEHGARAMVSDALDKLMDTLGDATAVPAAEDEEHDLSEAVPDDAAAEEEDSDDDSETMTVMQANRARDWRTLARDPTERPVNSIRANALQAFRKIFRSGAASTADMDAMSEFTASRSARHAMSRAMATTNVEEAIEVMIRSLGTNLHGLNKHLFDMHQFMVEDRLHDQMGVDRACGSVRRYMANAMAECTDLMAALERRAIDAEVSACRLLLDRIGVLDTCVRNIVESSRAEQIPSKPLPFLRIDAAPTDHGAVVSGHFAYDGGAAVTSFAVAAYHDERHLFTVTAFKDGSVQVKDGATAGPMRTKNMLITGIQRVIHDLNNPQRRTPFADYEFELVVVDPKSHGESRITNGELLTIKVAVCNDIGCRETSLIVIPADYEELRRQPAISAAERLCADLRACPRFIILLRSFIDDGCMLEDLPEQSREAVRRASDSIAQSIAALSVLDSARQEVEATGRRAHVTGMHDSAVRVIEGIEQLQAAIGPVEAVVREASAEATVAMENLQSLVMTITEAATRWGGFARGLLRILRE